ncbi:hypothetical protein TRVL_01082 [Trypanosoma vivax]|nr:hypothetical protein TRVL_01082 [Trypanosoma vivax]
MVLLYVAPVKYWMQSYVNGLLKCCSRDGHLGDNVGEQSSKPRGKTAITDIIHLVEDFMLTMTFCFATIVYCPVPMCVFIISHMLPSDSTSMRARVRVHVSVLVPY